MEAETVDAGGNQLIANQDCNTELFWALWGAGGGNFGIAARQGRRKCL
ncbi:hypothetical protein [Sporomusa acidovorans]|nr:hypothetical protein [Sporomusa acidovorans]